MKPSTFCEQSCLRDTLALCSLNREDKGPCLHPAPSQCLRVAALGGSRLQDLPNTSSAWSWDCRRGSPIRSLEHGVLFLSQGPGIPLQDPEEAPKCLVPTNTTLSFKDPGNEGGPPLVLHDFTSRVWLHLESPSFPVRPHAGFCVDRMWGALNLHSGCLSQN